MSTKRKTAEALRRATAKAVKEIQKEVDATDFSKELDAWHQELELSASIGASEAVITVDRTRYDWTEEPLDKRLKARLTKVTKLFESDGFKVEPSITYNGTETFWALKVSW